LCGGALYAHIEYSRQLAIKSDVIRDAFARVGRHPIDRPIDGRGIAGSGLPHARAFHVHGARAGFYREGTHQLCDAAATRQLRPECVAAVPALAAALDRDARGAAASIAITENVAGTERAAHVELRRACTWRTTCSPGPPPNPAWRDQRRDVTTGQVVETGTPVVHDPLDACHRRTRGRGHAPAARRVILPGQPLPARSLVRRWPRRRPTAGKWSISMPVSGCSR
jgi:hypothetical protein